MDDFSFKNNLSDVKKLRALLNKQEMQYLQHGGIPSTKIYIQFEGVFQGADIVWNACIRTVEDYSIRNEVASDPRQFICINIEGGVHFIEVALNIPLINQGVIERTIIMIRKYKRLQIGRHEYGARSKTQ